MRATTLDLTTQYYFYECSICDCLHPCGFAGDCRDDNNRFALDELEKRYGWSNVFVVSMEEADDYPAMKTTKGD